MVGSETAPKKERKAKSKIRWFTVPEKDLNEYADYKDALSHASKQNKDGNRTAIIGTTKVRKAQEERVTVFK